MRTPLLSLLIMICLVSCKEDKTDKKETDNNQNTVVFNDSDYVLDDTYEMGDVRRYGLFPDSTHNSGHPFTKKSRLETILDLAENEGIEMTFPKGYYNTALILKGRKNVTLNFEDAELGGMFQIIEQDSTPSQNITFKGNLITYAGFFSRKSQDIKMDKLRISSDASKNIYELRSKGCQIYAGSKNIEINELIIDDLGSGDSSYKYVSAALAIEGWNNNPENVQIKKVHIKSSDRHGIYLTGKSHLIGTVIIDKFGIGSSKDMVAMQDAVKGEESEFKALWINKCYDSFIENITINEKDSKGKYAVHFDQGTKEQPVTIGLLKIDNDNPNITFLEEESNGVIVEVQE